MRNIAFTLTMLLGLVTSAQATEGDIDAGKQKSATCVACHSVDGNSAISMYPKIAGQHSEYIYKQLKEFKSGDRKDPVMAGMVAALSDQDMKDLAAYFSSQTMSAGETPEDVVEAGELLYRGGDMERGIPACIACHGP
ncbi:MAG: cytochrome c, partial [Gammaproteobacteria bacterium]|nr:cytochrome c [Gammaproteobacteria bacterium]